MIWQKTPYSTKLTMGIELELQLIDLNTANLTQASPELLQLINHKNNFPGIYSAELTQGMIEVASGIHTSYSELLLQLHAIRSSLLESANTLNIGISSGGTHPFQTWSEQQIYDTPRYNNFSNEYGYLAKQFTVFGQHIHIGCNSGDDALYLLHALNRYVPHFIALAASSPYIDSHDTSFDSARLNSIAAFPLSGYAPFLLTWEEFIDSYYTKMQQAGIVAGIKDLYWDIRPQPKYGTLELRVCDTPLSLEKAASLASYLQVLATYILATREEQPNESDYLVYNYNKFQAARFGMHASIHNTLATDNLSLSKDILNTLAKIQPFAKNLNAELALDNINNYLSHNNDASYIRKQFKQHHDHKLMVLDLVSQFKQ